MKIRRHLVIVLISTLALGATSAVLAQEATPPPPPAKEEPAKEAPAKEEPAKAPRSAGSCAEPAAAPEAPAAPAAAPASRTGGSTRSRAGSDPGSGAGSDPGSGVGSDSWPAAVVAPAPKATPKALGASAMAFAPLADSYKKAYDDMQTWMTSIDAQTASVDAQILKAQDQIKANETAMAAAKTAGDSKKVEVAPIGEQDAHERDHESPEEPRRDAERVHEASVAEGQAIPGRFRTPRSLR